MQKRRSYKGRNNPNSILNDATVEEIKRLYESGSFSQAELARRFNVSRSTVGHIVTGRRWK